MRVGLISFHSFLEPGGVKRHVLGLYKEFKKRGVETKIIVPRREFKENYGKNVILLGTSFPINFGGSKSDLDINFNPISVEKTLRTEKFDVLHFHNFVIPSALQILNSPITDKTLNILTFHSNIDGSRLLKNFPGLLYLLNRVCQWKIDGIIGVAPLTLKIFKKYDGPKTLIPNGVDLEEFNPNAPKLKKFSDGKINILFVGRIEARKGLIYLLRAFRILEKKFSNLRLIVVGEGELKKDCHDYVIKNNLKEVHFVGKITGRELVSYYNSCDIFCAPSIFGESFGIVLLEAMACAKPVVAFANQGYKELLKGKMGVEFLAKPKDFRELAQKIEILIKNPNLRTEMGKWGLKEAKKYSWQRVANRVLDFYKFCRKHKEKRQTNDFPVEEFLEKANKFLTQEVFKWLKEW